MVNFRILELNYLFCADSRKSNVEELKIGIRQIPILGIMTFDSFSIYFDTVIEITF